MSGRGRPEQLGESGGDHVDRDTGFEKSLTRNRDLGPPAGGPKFLP